MISETPTVMNPPIVIKVRQPLAVVSGVSSSAGSPSRAATPAAAVCGSALRPRRARTAARQRARALALTKPDERRRQQAVGDVDRGDVDGQTEVAVHGRRDQPRDHALRLFAVERVDQAPTDQDGGVVWVAPEDERVGRSVVVEQEPRRLDAGGHGELVDDVGELDLGGVVGPCGSGTHPERDPVAADPTQPPGDREVGDDEQHDPGDHPDDRDPGEGLDRSRVAVDEPVEEAPDGAADVRRRHDRG